MKIESVDSDYRYNFLEKWFLRKIIKKTVTQGWSHRLRIIEFYRLLIDGARLEFSEDNKPTLDMFLRDCHEEAIK